MTDKDKKKLALRFLKEIGLLTAWKTYISYELSRGCYSSFKKPWYYKKYVDSIFGESDFTFFIERNYRIFMGAPITEIFRYYLIEIKKISPIEMLRPSYTATAPHEFFELKRKNRIFIS